MMGHAALEACRILREQVQESVAASWQCKRDEVLLGHGKAWLSFDTTKTMPVVAAEVPPTVLASAVSGTAGAGAPVGSRHARSVAPRVTASLICGRINDLPDDSCVRYDARQLSRERREQPVHVVAG